MTTKISTPSGDTTKEQRIIVASMLSMHTCRDAVPLALEKLAPTDFTDHTYRAIFNAIRPVAERVCAKKTDTPKQLGIYEVLAEAEQQGTDDVVTSVLLAQLASDDWSTSVDLHIDRMITTRNRGKVISIHERRLEAAQHDGKDLERTVAESRREFEELHEEIRKERQSLTKSWVTLGDLLEEDIPAPTSRIGDGLLEEGGFGILYGQSGIGKTFAAVELACAHAQGVPWFGFTTKAGTVGLFSLELSDYRIQQRLRTIQTERAPWTDNLLIQRTSLTGFGFDINNEAQYSQLADWIVQQQIDLAIIDPLNRAHVADENSTQEMGAVCLQIHRLRHETGAAVLVLHHEPKNVANLSDMAALRGSGRLQNDPQLLMRLVKSKGHLQLRFPKVTNADEPKPIWLERGDEGRLAIMDGGPLDASEAAEERRGTLVQICREYDRPFTFREAYDALLAFGITVSERTVRADFKAMADSKGLAAIGPRSSRKYLWQGAETVAEQLPMQNESD